MTELATGSGLTDITRYELDLVEQALHLTQNVVAYSYAIHATIAPLGISHQAGCYYSSQVS